MLNFHGRTCLLIGAEYTATASLLLSFDEDKGLDIAFPEVFILKVEVVSFLLDFIDLAEAVHVELPHERLYFVVAEEQR